MLITEDQIRRILRDHDVESLRTKRIYHIICILIDKQKNEIVGINNIRGENRYRHNFHAEYEVLRKIDKTKKYTMIIINLAPDNYTFKDSHPCESCINEIVKSGCIKYLVLCRKQYTKKNKYNNSILRRKKV